MITVIIRERCVVHTTHAKNSQNNDNKKHRKCQNDFSDNHHFTFTHNSINLEKTK